MINTNTSLSKVKQCQLLSISRSSLYYQPSPVSNENKILMDEIDKIHMARPFLGSRQITDELNELDYPINRKRVQRLMRIMGIQAIYPEPKTTQANTAHKKYPYLLRGINVGTSNQVWATDITYIPMAKGFVYLTAIMDWYSRKVLSWRLSNTMDVGFCLDALEEAISRYGAPIIFNSDQGSQYTSGLFTQTLKQNCIEISMDGKGAWRDNVFVERLWRRVKYEEVYLNSY